MENWKHVHICTFAFFQFPTLPIFHIYNLYFSNFPLVHFCIPILTPIYPNIPIQSSIYHKHSPQDSIRVLHTFEGGVSKHPVLPTGHYLMYKTYSAMVQLYVTSNHRFCEHMCHVWHCHIDLYIGKMHIIM